MGLIPARPGPGDDAGGAEALAEAEALAVLRQHGGRIDAALPHFLSAAGPTGAVVGVAGAPLAPLQRSNGPSAAARPAPAATTGGGVAGRAGKRAAGQTDLRAAFGLVAKPARRT